MPRSNRDSPPHCLRTYKFCWCDFAALASFNLGRLDPFYVIVIDICKWDPNDIRNQPLIVA